VTAVIQAAMMLVRGISELPRRKRKGSDISLKEKSVRVQR
jgi:hypothetical protein